MLLDDGRGIGVTVYAGVWFEFEESHAAPLGWADKVPFGISVLEILTYTFIRKITYLCLVRDGIKKRSIRCRLFISTYCELVFRNGDTDGAELFPKM